MGRVRQPAHPLLFSPLNLKVFTPGPAKTPTTGSRAPPTSLLIVETSRAMEKRTINLARALDRLLGSGMQGQIRSGDTLGVWTYNDELHAGDFPLQTWSADSQKQITSTVLKFVAAQKFNKQA